MKFGRDERPKIVILKSLEMNWKFKTQMAHLVSVKCYWETGINGGGSCTPRPSTVMGGPSLAMGVELMSG